MLARMFPLAQLCRMTALAAAMMGNPTAEGSRSDVALSPEQVGAIGRLAELIPLLAKPILEAEDAEALTVALDDALVSGLFSDVLIGSVRVLASAGSSAARTHDAEGDRIAAALVARGGDAEQVRLGLALERLAADLSADVVAAAADRVEVEQLAASFADIEALLFDVSTPLQVREALQAGLEAALCSIALHQAVHASDISPEATRPPSHSTGDIGPTWLVTELIERWLEGNRRALPTSLAMSQASPELRARAERLLGAEALRDAITTLAEDEARADAIAIGLQELAEHAARQPDGVWPKS